LDRIREVRLDRRRGMDMRRGVRLDRIRGVGWIGKEE